MTAAPSRIWVSSSAKRWCSSGDWSVDRNDWDAEMGFPDAEYVRADLADAQAQENARLRDILKMAARTIDTLANESEIGREDVDWKGPLREANAATGETQ